MKIVDLLLIFYSFNKNDSKNEYKESSICFFWGSLSMLFREEISLENKNIEIKIDFLRNEYMNFIKEEDVLLKINNIVFIIYKDIQKYINDKFYSLIIVVEHKKISVNFNYTDHSNEAQKSGKNKDKIKSFCKSIKVPKLKDLIFLDNFYGEVKLIKVTIKSMTNKKQMEICLENSYLSISPLIIFNS